MLYIDEQVSLPLDTQAFVGRSVAVLGITGSGKTNTAAVLIEELLSQGLPMTIVDIEGEYWGLKESYELLVAGRSEHAELEIGPENASQLAEISVQRGISVILDLSDYTQDEQYAFLVAYFKSLWEACSKSKQPYQVVLEEAHEFVPQGTNTPLKQLLTRIALRGRKRGLGIILMSQRSAKVEKDVLTQTSLLFLHKVVHPIDLKVYKDLIPLPGVEVEQIVGALQPGHVVVVSNHIPQVAHIRLRHTFHAGATPEFGQVAQPELRRIDASLLRELQAALVKTSKETGSKEARLERRIIELEALLAERDAEIVELHKQIALLSKLSVSMETVASPETLEIQQATVHRLVTGGTLAPAQVVEALPVNHRVPVQEIAPPLNEKKFQSFRRRFEQVPPRHRRLLYLLTEKDREMSIQELAAWLNVEENSLRKNPPTELLRLGLISRRHYRDGYHYTSIVRSQLQEGFPHADIELLVRRLFS